MPNLGTITVPDVVGLTRSDAEAKLIGAGLVVGAARAVSSASIPTGSVSRADPAAGTPVNSGSTVNLEVSSGPAPSSGSTQVTVPDVVGLTRPAAEAVLKSSGLVVGAVRTRHSREIPANGIGGTNPVPGTLVSLGAAIELDLSTGPAPSWTQNIPTALFALLGLILLGVVVYVVTKDGQVFLTSLARTEVARGLITFLIAIATVGIAIILAISTLVLAQGDEGDKRFDRGKQVLTTLIGVLGTIVGFYFGSDKDGGTQKPPTEQTQTSAPKITTATLPNGAANKPYALTTLQSTGLTPPLKWTVKPDLPTGFMWNASTGTITGTPTQTMPKTLFTFTVTDGATPATSLTADLTLEIK